MVTKISAGELQENLGELLDQVELRNRSIVIHKDGKAIAALVDAELFGRIQRMEQRFAELSSRIAAYSSAPIEQGIAEIETASRQERHR